MTASGLSFNQRRKIMAILNLTQHQATTEQIEAGVIDLPADIIPIVRNLLTFDTIPTSDEMNARAHDIAVIAADCAASEDRGDNAGFALSAMIGGAPFFMTTLERALLNAGITPVYAFSVRDSREEPDGNGGVRKVNVFRHVGFIEASQ
jgi:hypothetical protein